MPPHIVLLISSIWIFGCLITKGHKASLKYGSLGMAGYPNNTISSPSSSSRIEIFISFKLTVVFGV